MRAATPVRPFRIVQLHAEQCGHRWKTRTARTDEEIESGRSECPICRDDLGRQCKRVVTIEHVRSLCDNGCGNKLTVYNLTGICGPCETAHARKIAALTEPQWRSLLAVQKAAVLSLLPGTWPALRVKAALMHRREPMAPAWRINGVDIQRILNAAIKAGEVVQWNPDGGRPVYRLVATVELTKRQEELLAVLPATLAQVASKCGYNDAEGPRRTFERMEKLGLVKRTGRGIANNPFVYHRVKDGA